MVCEPSQIRPEFPFCRHHDPQGAQLRNERLEGFGIGTICNHVPDGHAPVGLLKGEMAEVGKNQGQFLFVIGTPGRLPWIFHEDNANGLGVFSGEWTYLIGQLIIRDKKPTSALWSPLPFCQLSSEMTHGAWFLVEYPAIFAYHLYGCKTETVADTLKTFLNPAPLRLYHRTSCFPAQR